MTDTTAPAPTITPVVIKLSEVQQKAVREMSLMGSSNTSASELASNWLKSKIKSEYKRIFKSKDVIKKLEAQYNNYVSMLKLTNDEPKITKENFIKGQLQKVNEVLVEL